MSQRRGKDRLATQPHFASISAAANVAYSPETRKEYRVGAHAQRLACVRLNMETIEMLDW